MSHQPCVPRIFVCKLLVTYLLKKLWGSNLSLNIIINYSLYVFLLILLKMTNDPASPGFHIPKLLFNLL